jgi:type II secretory ATPase GspE/PulE/Tfp pilus assembly ATPase PilB-like protein
MPAEKNGAPSRSEASAPELLEEIIRHAESAGASDIHLQMVDGAAQVAFRLDGVMTPGASVPEEVAPRLFGRIKFLSRLKTYQDSLPQDGRIDRSDLGSRNDVRVSTYPTVTGEKIVLRLFQGSTVRPLKELGFDEKARVALERFLHSGSGLLLLTGPAGSGKTTTIHGCLAELAATGGRHIITVEDPVEQIIPGIMQTEVSEARGLTFAKAARHLLRQDPQVLVVGEIRDEETAAIAVRAALTGHQMISTLHAGSCRGVWERLLALCPDRSAALAGLELIWNQRLIRRLCPDCGGERCEKCLRTGFRGRVPVVEWFRLDDASRSRIRELGSSAIEPTGRLEDSARSLLDGGVTSRAEFERVFNR